MNSNLINTLLIGHFLFFQYIYFYSISLTKNVKQF